MYYAQYIFTLKLNKCYVYLLKEFFNADDITVSIDLNKNVIEIILHIFSLSVCTYECSLITL